MDNKNITELMKEYFSLREETKKLKKGRPIHFCEYTRDYMFGSCMSNEIEYENMCESCRGLQEWIDKINNVGHKKSAILNRVRNIVNKNYETSKI